MARIFALIARVHRVLHRVSCSYEMIPNAPKHYETHKNMSLGSNGVDQVHLLGKITTWLRGTDICINCTSSVCFAPSLMQLRNDPKCTKTLWNAPKHEFMVQWLYYVHWLRKFTTWLRGTNFALIAPVQYVLHQVSCSYETIPNAPKYYETHRNISLGSNGVDWVRSLQKIPTWLRGTNFCINCTSSVCFAPSFVQLRNDPKCTQILWKPTETLV